MVIEYLGQEQHMNLKENTGSCEFFFDVDGTSVVVTVESDKDDKYQYKNHHKVSAKIEENLKKFIEKNNMLDCTMVGAEAAEVEIMKF